MDNSTTNYNLEEATNVSLVSISENVNVIGIENHLDDNIVESIDSMECIGNNNPEVISESDNNKLSDREIKIIANPITIGPYDSNFVYHFKIVDSNGTPVTNCHYQYEVDNSQSGGAHTNEEGEGYFHYSTSRSLSSGKHPIIIYCYGKTLKTYFNVMSDNVKKSKSKVKVSKVTKAKPKSKFTVKVPVKLNKKMSKTYGKYKVTTYKWVDYYSNGKKDAHLRISIYKNGKKLLGFDAKYWVHYKTGGGVWLYTKNAGGGYKSNPIGYNNVLKTDKVTATIWP